MAKTFGQELLESMGQALAHAKGQKTGAKVHTINVPDVKAIRRSLKMTQPEFAQAYRIPLPTLKGWEQGRRHPDATAAAYLSVIAAMPKEARAVLN